MAAVAASVIPALDQRPVKNTICLFDVDGTLTPARRVCFYPYKYTRSKETNIDTDGLPRDARSPVAAPSQGRHWLRRR